IAMALMECQRTRSDFRIEIVATDISREVLGRAREGFFTDFEVRRGLSEERIHRFFSPCRGGWQIQDEIRAMVRFEQLNLIEPFDHLGSFDLAFCRNVLIYFNPETKKYVLERISAALKPEGLLVLGGTETTLGITQSFERAAEFPAAIFRKSGNR
ncbi:MAG: CheR family methyltransferase, partial [Bdellovibrionota bacterium]